MRAMHNVHLEIILDLRHMQELGLLTRILRIPGLNPQSSDRQR